MIDFDKIIKDYVKAKQEENKKEMVIGRYSASMLGSCMRKTYYSYLYPVDFDTEKLRIFEMGNVIHEFVVNLLGNTPHAELTATEKELAIVDTIGDLMISGRLDDMIIVKTIDASGNEVSEKVIIEVKSARSLEYFDSPKEPHMMQLMIYMKNMSYYGIKKGVLLYVDKNSLKTRSFETGFREDIYNKAIERARTIHQHLLARNPPIAEGKVNKGQEFECHYCEHRKRCDVDCHDAAKLAATKKV
jgi:hypothetical protein